MVAVADPPISKAALLKSIGSRSGRFGIATAAAYLKSLEACFNGTGPCGLLPPGVTESQWRQIVKESEGKLTFSTRGMNVKSVVAPSASNYMLEFDAVITSAAKDRDGDVLETSGAFLDPAAPLLWQHDPLVPLGKVLRQTSKTTSKLTARCGIAKFDGNGPLGAIAHDACVLIECNSLRISHGFDPQEFSELDDKEGRWLVSKFTILEASLVSIPANEQAIITAFSRNKLHSGLVKAWAAKKFESRPVQGIGFTPKAPNAEHQCGCQCDCHKCKSAKSAKDSVRHEGESLQDCVSRKIGILENEGGRSHEQNQAIAYAMCQGKSKEEAIAFFANQQEPKMATETTPVVPVTTKAVSPAENDAEAARLVGQGPQQGDHNWHERHASEEARVANAGGEGDSVQEFDPANPREGDLAMQIATGGGKRNDADNQQASFVEPGGEGQPGDPGEGEERPAPENPMPIATGKGKKDVTDSEFVDTHDHDDPLHHDVAGTVNEHVMVDVPGLKAMARKIDHSGKEGSVYLHNEHGAVHHVAHADDMHPDNSHKYHSAEQIHKMYKGVRGVKSVHVAMGTHPTKASGYELVHRGGSVPAEHDYKGNKSGRVISAHNMKRLAEVKDHLEHMHGMGPEHVSHIAKAHVKASHAHVATMIKESEAAANAGFTSTAKSSMDPNADGAYGAAAVPADDVNSQAQLDRFSGVPADDAQKPFDNFPGTPTDNVDPQDQLARFGERRATDPAMTAGVDTTNIPESIGTRVLDVIFDIEKLDDDILEVLRSAVADELKVRDAKNKDFEEFVSTMELLEV